MRIARALRSVLLKELAIKISFFPNKIPGLCLVFAVAALGREDRRLSHEHLFLRTLLPLADWISRDPYQIVPKHLSYRLCANWN